VNTAIVVSTHSAASIRAAEKCAAAISDQVKDINLVINCFYSQGVLNGTHPGIVDVIETAKIRLAGIIDYDIKMKTAQELGKTVFDIKLTKQMLSFAKLAARLEGDDIPLDKKIVGVRKEKLYYVHSRRKL
jgi:septum site-determining protein MinD